MPPIFTKPHGGGIIRIGRCKMAGTTYNCDIGAYEWVVALSVTPSLIDATVPVTLTVNGDGFAADSVVLWGDTAVSTVTEHKR